jgi:hypothetical protein
MDSGWAVLAPGQTASKQELPITSVRNLYTIFFKYFLLGDIPLKVPFPLFLSFRYFFCGKKVTPVCVTQSGRKKAVRNQLRHDFGLVP